MADLQFLRQVKLVVNGMGGDGLDLSQMRLRFSIKAADVESPNNAMIRIYNLSDATVKQITEEYKEVELQAGYRFNLGTIFKGTIKWFRAGREPNGVDTYLDLLAADGDIPYNQAFISKSFAADTPREDRINALIAPMQELGLGTSPQIHLNETGGVVVNGRGKVAFGMARAAAAKEAEAAGATWSIQDNEFVMIDKTKYLPGEAVVLNGQSGLIGRPEQTVEGIKARCLINPGIKVGGLVKLDNAAINTTQLADSSAAPIAYNQYTALQYVANISGDGLYRAYVIEYEGDTRSGPWYADLTLLAVSESENLVTIE